MRRETLSPVLRGPLLTLALLSLTSCLTPESVDCPSGLVCPAGQKCAASQDVCIQTDCGDGVVQLGETCDDGNILDGDGCSRTCASNESCGNGVVDITPAGGGTRREACDDGNNVDGDGCSADCLSSELCGNGVVDRASREACDDGNNVDGDDCSADCVSNEECGNGIVDRAVGEVCDDGNTKSGDHCSFDCRSGESCGNGIRDADEECDDGNASNEDNCLISCKIAICGDGKVDQENPRTEQCDTGGESATCNYNCTNRKCGDGIVNVHAGEQCDDNNTVNDDGCTAACQVARCGDGILSTSNGEQCDDGNTSNDDDCTATCQTSRCGDGIVRASTGEQCDDGNGSNEDGCTNSCKWARCGDGYVQGGAEDCDPGRDSVCNPNCKWNACGDGIVNASAGELCDDGNINSCGTCSSNCKQAQDVSRATGRIIGVPPDVISAETFTFSSSAGALVFEFDKNGEVAAGHIKVDIDNMRESDQVARAIQDAINNQASNPLLEWRVSGRSWNVVMLEYKEEGEIGSDRSISENVGVPGFSAEILTRGSGYDCSAGRGCVRNEDCKSKRCTIPVGQVTGTCN